MLAGHATGCWLSSLSAGVLYNREKNESLRILQYVCEITRNWVLDDWERTMRWLKNNWETTAIWPVQIKDTSFVLLHRLFSILWLKYNCEMAMSCLWVDQEIAVTCTENNHTDNKRQFLLQFVWIIPYK